VPGTKKHIGPEKECLAPKRTTSDLKKGAWHQKTRRTYGPLLFEIHVFVRVGSCGPWLNFFEYILYLRKICGAFPPTLISAFFAELFTFPGR
jgi:hypothetical protein